MGYFINFVDAGQTFVYSVEHAKRYLESLYVIAQKNADWEQIEVQ